MHDLIERQAAIDALGGNEPVGDPSKMDDDDVVKMWERIRIINIINKLPTAQPETCGDADKLKICKFEYINACKIVAHPTPDTSKGDIHDAYAVIKALHPIFGDEEF